MTRRRKIMAAVAVPVVGIAATAVWAAEKASSGEGPGGLLERPIARLIRGHIGRWMVLRSELDLTDAQRTQIRETIQGHRTEIAPAVRKIVEKRRALRAAVLADSPDEKAIRAAADDLGRAIGDAAVLASRVAREVRPALTPQQRERIEKFRGECEAATDSFLDKMMEP